MYQQELIQYFRNFRATLDQHIRDNTKFSKNEINQELISICNKLVENQIYLESEMLNKLYRFYIECENTRAIAADANEFYIAINNKYIAATRQYQNIQGEFFKKMALLKVNEILLMYDI